jgi:phosphate uptake regulator
MKRKVIQQGPATLMISLPAKWVKENNVQKGDEIDLVEEKGRLVVSCEKEGTETETKEWHSTDAGVFNEYFVNYFYQKGYDVVTIRYDDPKYTALIERRVRDLMGFEVVESSEKHTTLRMLVKIDEQEFETVLKKLFQITLVMGDKITEALRDNNTALFDEVKQDEKENNRYCDLCMRILYKNRYNYPDNGFAYFALLRELEQVGDLYKFLADSFGSSVSADVMTLYNDVHQFFRLYYDLYYKYDKENAERFFAMKKELLQRCKEIVHVVSKEEMLVVSHLTSLVHAVFNLKGPLFLQKV